MEGGERGDIQMERELEGVDWQCNGPSLTSTPADQV